MVLGEQPGDEAEYPLRRALEHDESADVKDMAAQLLRQRKKDPEKLDR